MEVRKTARVLLLDPAGRLLLVKFFDPFVHEPGQAPSREPFWATVGGRLEEGEDVRAAARREILEETGQDQVEIGPVVWVGEQVLVLKQGPRLLKESFVVAHTGRETVSDAGWTRQERTAILQMTWWTLAELRATRETVYPAVLVDLLPPILRGQYPNPPQTIAL